MDDESQSNKINEENKETEEYEFHYNFITLPWDDRSRRSRIGIIALHISLTVCLIACVINGLVMIYWGDNKSPKAEVFCHRVRFEDYSYVARIYSETWKRMLCLGVMVNMNSALAHSTCVRSKPMILHLGSLSEPRCRKGFMIDRVQYFENETVLSNNMVLLTTYEDTAECTEAVSIGKHLNMKLRCNVIGATIESKRSIGGSLSRQSVALEPCVFTDNNTDNDVTKNEKICVRDSIRCPINVGDILLQKDQLYGVAITSNSGKYNKSDLIHFINVQTFYEKLALNSTIK